MEEKKVIERALSNEPAQPSKWFLHLQQLIAIDKEISDHIAKGGDLADLSDKYPCFKPSPNGPVYF